MITIYFIDDDFFFIQPFHCFAIFITFLYFAILLDTIDIWLPDEADASRISEDAYVLGQIRPHWWYFRDTLPFSPPFRHFALRRHWYVSRFDTFSHIFSSFLRFILRHFIFIFSFSIDAASLVISRFQLIDITSQARAPRWLSARLAALHEPPPIAPAYAISAPAMPMAGRHYCAPCQLPVEIPPAASHASFAEWY